ncbi:MAG: type II toxin-antitoxin system RelE/ParE family toxin [Magnetococcales bacterium]|nr:type II toxin-antitoxin system RelE/ParE family toxin [Magnetococcales bacterium]
MDIDRSALTTVSYSRQALKTLRRLSVTDGKRIRDAIQTFFETGTGDVVRLREREGFRLRVGDWRVIFDLEGHVLAVLKIGPRGDVYHH